MPTYADMQTAIADDLDDTTLEYKNQIKTAIQAAIRYCERTPYYFNQTRDVTFPTVQGQAFYGALANANIPTLVHIVSAWSEDASGQRFELRWANEDDIELVSDNSAAQGEPYWYTYFAQQVRVYPIPGATVYTIRLQLGPYRLAPVVLDTDTNAWFSEAFDMIKARAKYIVAKDTLKDVNVATEALNDYQDQEVAIAAETSKRGSGDTIQATDF